MRQEIHWVGETRLVPITGKPKRVWTLMDGTEDPTYKHVLPITPVHLKNAFLEDQHHDWSMFRGDLRYYSRVALHSVWILVEFES